ncbi:MAG: hypothetical protein ACE5I1_03825 [bacterium]
MACNEARQRSWEKALTWGSARMMPVVCLNGSYLKWEDSQIVS